MHIFDPVTLTSRYLTKTKYLYQHTPFVASKVNICGSPSSWGITSPFAKLVVLPIRDVGRIFPAPEDKLCF